MSEELLQGPPKAEVRSSNPLGWVMRPLKELKVRRRRNWFHFRLGQAKGLTIDCHRQANTMQSRNAFLTKAGLTPVSKLSLNTNCFVGDI